MKATTRPTPTAKLPTPWENLVFAAKVQGLRLRRSFQDARQSVTKHRSTDKPESFKLIAESRTPLYPDPNPQERRLQLGKVQNLRVAAKALHGLQIPAGSIFSFWKQLGKTKSGKGYVEGRQLQEGCLIPVVGGGICQLSNALYDVALRSGCEIVERHAHSRHVPNSPVAANRDATVAWNYIDLRFRAKADLWLECRLTRDELIVAVYAAEGRGDLLRLQPLPKERSSANSCASCGQEGCFQHQQIDHTIAEQRTAYLLDQVWPEFDQWTSRRCRQGDLACLPIDTRRFKVPRYAWTLIPDAQRRYTTLITLRRSWKSRRLAQQGAARQLAYLAAAKELAEAYCRSLTSDCTEIVVTQTLLPFVWLSGALGGRRLTVLATRLPMDELQARLDRQFALHPERGLLADFRADDKLVKAESEALEAADLIVTPHAEIAKLFPNKTELLPWTLPPARQKDRGDLVAFPGPTVARKGAYEVREVARELGLRLRVAGSLIEGSSFWDGLDWSRPNGHWLDGVGLVVHPVVVEEQPRKLLEAIACGVPVITTRESGLPDQPGVKFVAVGDVAALREAVKSELTF